MSSTVHEYHLQTRLTERELRKGIKAARDVLGTTTSTWFTIVALVVLTAMMAMIWATSLGHEWGWLVITGAIAGGAGYLWLSTRLRFLVRRVLRREPGALEGIGSMAVTDDCFILHGGSGWRSGAETRLPWTAVKSVVRDKDGTMLVVLFGPRTRPRAVKILVVMVPRAVERTGVDDPWPALVAFVEERGRDTGFDVKAQRLTWTWS